MSGIKTFHEAPKAIFNDVQKVTDGDYALVHLFDKDEEYLDLFTQARDAGREIILDNSVFELGRSFDPDVFAAWVREFRPTWYIVPDVLNDGEATVNQFNEFVAKYPDLPGKRIGVVQGTMLDELIWCYQQLEPKCDKVAISFDSTLYTTLFHAPTVWQSMMMGRAYMLRFMEARGIINTSKPHHLLGVALPQEVALYKQMPWVDSVDTSNPVVHGIKGIRYESGGLRDKETQKLHELIDYVPDLFQREDIMFNIQAFRRFAER